MKSPLIWSAWIWQIYLCLHKIHAPFIVGILAGGMNKLTNESIIVVESKLTVAIMSEC